MEQVIQASRRKYHYIYKTTNIINKKFYIGMHSTDNLEDGYVGSGKKLTRSIKKYGKENFKTDILEYCESREALRLREQELVNKELLLDSQCMNLMIGGEGGWETVNKNYNSTKRRTSMLNRSPELVKQWIEKSLAVKSILLLDKKHREMVSNKISIGRKKYVELNGHWWTGKLHTEETKKKIGLANSIKQSGSKNSQYGTTWKWITNVINHKYSKIKIDEEVPNGFILGIVNFNLIKEKQKIELEKKIIEQTLLENKINLYKDYHEIYKKFGFEEFKKLTNFEYSERTLLIKFSKLIPDFVIFKRKYNKRNI